MMHYTLLLAVPVPSFILSPLIAMVLPAIAGTVTAVVYQWAKKGISWVDALAPQYHTYAMGFFAIALPQVAKWVPGFPVSLEGFDSTAIQSLVMLALTQVTHLLLKTPTAKPNVAE